LGKLASVLQKDKFGLTHIVVLSINDPALPADAGAPFRKLGLEFYRYEEIIDIGSQHLKPLPSIDPEWIHYVCYSSGTTGVPKGVIISHRSMVSNSLDVTIAISVDKSAVHLSYLPLPHVFERSAVSVLTFVGGRMGIFSGSVARLTEDMQVLRPTLLCAVPRVLNRVYDTVMAKMSAAGALSRGLFWGLWYWKRFWMQQGSGSWLADTLVFNKIMAQTGGRINEWVIGGAALDPWIHEFMMYALGCGFRVGYGASELGSGNVVNPFDTRGSVPGTVGGPMPNTEIKLDHLEDYDDPLCGEILAGGQMLCSGYLYDDEQTKKLFVDDTRTWVHTGDIGKWDENGYLKIVDRIRSVFKLAQGEYVAAELLTLTYELAPLVAQIFIYGDSVRDSLVAVVVPDRPATARFLGKDRLNDEEFAQACRNPALEEAIKKQLDELATQRKLPGYERIRKIACEPVPWTTDNDLMTPTFKLRRKKLTDKYRGVIEGLYASLATSGPPK
jgi:long-chain acyl-CoA synthetase